MARAMKNAKQAKQAASTPQKYLCPYCGEMKLKSEFYTTSDPMVKIGITLMCKECAKKIARNYDETNDTYGDCTRASIQDALERL